MTLKERAYQALRKKILHADLEPGAFVSERQLADQLGMSRSPVRSAVERLESDGLVKYTPQKGIFVKELSLRTVVELFDFRLALEPFAVRQLAQSRTSDDTLKLLAENLVQQEAFVALHDPVQFTEADSRFHLLIAAGTGNQEILQAMERLQDRLYRVALAVLQKDSSRIKPSFEDHQAVFDSIVRKDADAAVGVMQAHLEYGKKTLVS